MIRNISRVRLSDGTIIDGLELDKLLSDVAERWNNIKDSDLRARHVPQRMVGGFNPVPVTLGTQPTLPFIGAWNSTNQTVGGAVPVSGFQNPWRLKGSDKEGIDQYNLTGDYLIWSTSLQLSAPVVIDSLSLTLSQDAYHINTFVWGSSPPAGKVAGEPVDDLQITLEVDPESLPDDRSRTDVEIMAVDFLVNSASWTPQVWPGALPNTGTPNLLAAPSGLFLHLTGLCLPIPARARLRLSIGVPSYSNVNTAGWQDEPVNKQVWSWSLGWLEALRTV